MDSVVDGVLLGSDRVVDCASYLLHAVVVETVAVAVGVADAAVDAVGTDHVADCESYLLLLLAHDVVVAC